jgi:hypothetical protein
MEQGFNRWIMGLLKKQLKKYNYENIELKLQDNFITIIGNKDNIEVLVGYLQFKDVVKAVFEDNNSVKIELVDNWGR